ncbi:FOG: Ankyrin repeat [Plasmopara halstedii]|uniref:FOG: Ankyrin repeat n=1 Tax=Plasmopara halstedii TaxID=4781 RepID=A0A0P1A9P1_PLAHL|nr:FOG: Ankyrin repeat [Plasmopara halstedii]CEG37452.1 FOG: Ankyrin repeat [Plasmopara halstedii]|eukprot:XP_024573821.1 FOG: Ankyrin repeat [Plasmopara halstedii]
MCVNVWTAASDGDFESIKSFLASGGDVNAKDENGYTPLQAAVSYNHMELVIFLLASGADVTLGDNDLDTPLHRSETVECAKLLLEHGANMNARNSEGHTPFDVAIEDEHEELMKFYENLGADKSDRVFEDDNEHFPNGVSPEM